VNPADPYSRKLDSADLGVNEGQTTAHASLLSVENLTACYGKSKADVLKGVSLEVYSGQTLAIVSESGSGKSTLARSVTGLLEPRSGVLCFAGRELSANLKDRTREDLRELQFIHQMADIAMNPRQRVSTIIGRPLEFYFGMLGAERDARVAELLEQTELRRAFADRFPSELSGGQKQRVCIARALTARPNLIICDEVITALDPLIAQGIIKLLVDLQKDENVGYMFITHDLGVVKAIAVMNKGSIVRYGSKSRVLTPPFDYYTDLLLSSVPELEMWWLEDALASRRQR